MNNREKDARLHELLYGVKCEWRACATDPDSIGWSEKQALWDWELAEGDIDQAEFNQRLERAKAGIDEHWFREALHPCVQAGDIVWDVVPFYTESVEAAWMAQNKLPASLRNSYRVQLLLVAARDSIEHGVEYYSEYWALMNATPAQRVDAMLGVLEQQPALN